MLRFCYPFSILVIASISVAGCASKSTSGPGTENAGTQGKMDMLGHGVEVTQVTPLIYSIHVSMSTSNSETDARNEAMYKAAELSLAKGYKRFEIVGGDGFKRVPRKMQAGPLPLTLYTEPEGSLQIRMLENNLPANPAAFDAALEQARVMQARAAKKK